MIHIFSDISVNWENGKRFGAIVINNDEPIVVELGDGNTAKLEVECLAYGVKKAAEKYPDAIYIAHTDLTILNFTRTIEKSYFVEKFGGVFKPVHVLFDARQHKPYKRCHLWARAFTDCHGTKHPIKLNYKQQIPAI